MAFTPDGKTILTASVDKTVRLWDLEIGQPIGVSIEPQPRGSATAVPDGALIVAEPIGKTVRLRHASNGKEINKLLQDQAEVTAVAVSPDSKTVLTGNREGQARFWDVATGHPIGTPLPHPVRPINGVAFGRDGKTARSMAAVIDGFGTSPNQSPMTFQLLTAWVQALTGLELDEQGSIRVLDGAEWQQCRELLDQLGRLPAADRRSGSTPSYSATIQRRGHRLGSMQVLAGSRSCLR